MANCRKCTHITGLYEEHLNGNFGYICLVDGEPSKQRDFPYDEAEEVNCVLFVQSPTYPLVFTEFLTKSVNKY